MNDSGGAGRGWVGRRNVPTDSDTDTVSMNTE